MQSATAEDLHADVCAYLILRDVRERHWAALRERGEIQRFKDCDRHASARSIARGNWREGRTSCDHDLVRRVDVDGLVEWERNVVIHDGRVRGRVEHSDGCLREARQEFLGIAFALCSTSGAPRAECVPEVQI